MREVIGRFTLASFVVSFLTVTAVGYLRQSHRAPKAEHAGLLELTQVRIQSIIQRNFPELESYSIKLVTFDSNDSFFQTDVDGLFKSPNERVYYIEISPHFFNYPPGGDAIEAILIHEIAHILKYTQMSGLQLLSSGFRAWAMPLSQSNIDFEKDADRVVLKMGAGSGLKSYRRWLYKNLNIETVKIKKQIYLQPDEIDNYVLDLTMSPSG